MIKRLMAFAVVIAVASCVTPATPEVPPPPAPAAPGGLTAQPGERSIGLAWDDPDDASIVSYEVRLRAPQDADWRSWKVIAGSSHATTSHTLSELTPGVLYRVQVRARNAAGAGAPSEASAATHPPPPAAPEGLTAQSGERSIGLVWEASDDVSIASYEVRLRAPQDADWRSWKVVAGSTHATTSHTLPDLTVGVLYRVQVRARNAAGAGAPSETAAVPHPPLPAAPEGLTAQPGERSIGLDWNDPGDASIVAYEYRIRPEHEPDWPDWRSIAGSTHATTGYTLLRGLSGGVLYRVQVRAHNAAGAGAPSETSATPRAPALNGTPPAAPTGLAALPGDMSISIGWDDPGDASITAYEVRLRAPRDADWRSWRAIDDSTHATTGHTLPGLTNGVLYQLQVRARNAAGPGEPSETSATPRSPTSPAK